MKRKFTILIAALMLLTMVTQPKLVMGQERAAEVTWDFSSANNFLTSYPGSTHPGTGSSNNIGTFYYSDGTAFTATGTNRYFNSGYFLLGQKNATLQLHKANLKAKKKKALLTI